MQSATIRAGFAAALVVTLASCGTVTRGHEETVSVESRPHDAAIRTSTGQYCPQSPCSFRISRKTSFTATAEREGYKPGSIAVNTRVQGSGAAGFAGNVLLGGVIGMGVDAATGAALDHYPNPAIIVLEPIDPKNPKTPPQILPVTPPTTKTPSAAPAAKPIS